MYTLHKPENKHSNLKELKGNWSSGTPVTSAPERVRHKNYQFKGS